MNATLDLRNRFEKNYPIWGVDGSRWMDNSLTAAFPDPMKVVNLGGMIYGWKVTQGAGAYGFVDITFQRVWNACKLINAEQMRLARWPFHFWDYSTSHYTGSPELFGSAQADFFWKYLKPDPGELPAHLDMESFAPWGYINILNSYKPMQIGKGFCKRLDDLSGRETAIYTNLGLIKYMDDFFKVRPLTLANYTESLLMADCLVALAKLGWKGKLIQRQYASDGDVNEDGAPDGFALGMEAANVDLEVFNGGPPELSLVMGQALPAPTPPAPLPVVAPTFPQQEYGFGVVNCPSGLNLRSSPAVRSDNIIGWASDKTGVVIQNTIQNGADWWAVVGVKQYAAIRYQGTTYIK